MCNDINSTFLTKNDIAKYISQTNEIANQSEKADNQDVYLHEYKRLMDLYKKNGPFDNGRKECFDIPYIIGMLKFFLETGDYREAVSMLEDIIIHHDNTDPKIMFLVSDALEECEEYVEKVIRKEK